MRNIIMFLLISNMAMLSLSAQQTYKLVPANDIQKFDEGTVEYARTLKISFEAKGRLDYVAPIGFYAKCEVVTAAGKVIKQGDLLAKMDTTMQEEAVRSAEVLLKRAEEVLASKTNDYNRNMGLHDNRIISAKDLEQSTTDYKTATDDRNKAIIDLRQAHRVLDACYIRAPFDGIVEEVYATKGASLDVGKPVLQLSMVDPIKIKLTIPENTVQPYSRITRALVYPLLCDTPVPGWFSGENPLVGTLECYVENPVIHDQVIGEDGVEIPTVSRISFVKDIQNKEDIAPLWINTHALNRDDDQYFVWRLKGENLAQKPLTPNIAALEKVKIEPLDTFIQYGLETLIGIKAGSQLQESDILADTITASLKDGDMVSYLRKRHLFGVGDKVKVYLSSGNAENIFHVPLSVLRKNSDNPGYHVLVAGPQPEQIPVTVLNQTNNMARIYSSKLKKNLELIIK